MEWIHRDGPNSYPKEKGFYWVRISGDSESVDGHVIYDYPDYTTYANFTPALPEEYEDFDGGFKGTWSCPHDEEDEMIFAYYGPVDVPEYKKS